MDWRRHVMNTKAALLLITLSLFILPWQVSATTQIKEILLIDNHEYEIVELPLSEFLKSKNIIPTSEFAYSNNWRRYQGTWQVKDNHLYLMNLVSIPGRKQISPTEFGQTGYPILAYWFTGDLTVYKNKHNRTVSSKQLRFSSGQLISD